jgi:hypothetical protein
MTGGWYGQESAPTAHKTLDQGSSGGAETVFKREVAGKENFKADEPLRWLTPAKSQGVTHQARSSSLKKSEASKDFGVTAHNAH